MNAKPTYEDLEERIKKLEGDVAGNRKLPREFFGTEERFASYFRENPIPTAITAVKDGRYIDVNAAFEKITGFSREELIGQKTTTIGYITPEDREIFLREYRQKGYVENLELPMRVKGGDIKQALFNSSKMIIGGEEIFLTTVTDIDNLKRIQAELRRSEAKYRLLTETLSDVIFTTDKHLKLTYISPAVTRLRGYSVEEAMAEPLDRLMTPESLKVAMNGFASEMKLEATGFRDPNRTLTLELEVNRKGGSTVWTEVIFKPIRDEQDRFNGVLAVARDISERKRAEEQLRKSEEKYRLLTETLPDVVYTMDKDLRFTYVSSSVQQVHGYTVEEMITKLPADILTPESLKTAMSKFTKELELEARGAHDRNKTWTLELEVCNKDGSTKFTETIFRAIRDEQGSFIGLMGISRDISERKRAEEQLRKSEEKYRLLTETIPDVVFTMDTNLRFTYVSSSHEKLSGYTVEEAMTQSIDEFLTPASLETAMKTFAGVMEKEAQGLFNPNQTWMLEMEVRCKDGSTKWTETIYHALRDADHKAVGVLGISRDISERKRAEEEHRRLIEERQKALSEIKILSGMLPICSSCKKIRNDEGYWEQLEIYIRDHSGAEFSHGLCPECSNKYYAKLFEKKQ